MDYRTILSVLIVNSQPVLIGSKGDICNRTRFREEVPCDLEIIGIEGILKYMREITEKDVEAIPEMRKCISYPQEDRLSIIDNIVSLKYEGKAYTKKELLSAIMRMGKGFYNPIMVSQFIDGLFEYCRGSISGRMQGPCKPQRN